MNRTMFAVAVSGALAIPQFAHAATYEIDPVHSQVGFKARHLMVSWVRGTFGTFSGSINFDAKNPAVASVMASIDATSISTGNGQRDGHLKSPDFLDVAKYPTLAFKSKKFEGKNGKFKVTGDLTLHGVTKEVSLDVDGLSSESKDDWGNLRVGATGTTKISRKDFGLTWNKAVETGGVVVGDEIEITLDIEASRKPDAAK
jgi:polyisoprenoid-binding protein YceI